MPRPLSAFQAGRLVSRALAWVRALIHRLGFALCRLSRRLEPGHERARKDDALARKLLGMIAVKNLSDDDLTAELWTLCDPLPVGSRTSEILLEAATRLEKYRALTAEYAPRKAGRS